MTLSRRRILGSALTLATSALWHGKARAEPPRRPNILLILADDWSWQGTEAIDRLHLRMPTFARLCREGAEFRNAFAASPSCTASRGALLSGLWPWRLKQGANLVGTLPTEFPLYTEILERAGYHVGYSRKGWGPGSLAAAGRSHNPAGNPYEDFGKFLAQRPDGAPFCFWFGTHDPHRPYVKGEGLRAGIRPDEITVPPYLPDTPEVRADIVDYRYELERLDRESQTLLDQLAQLGELDDTIVAMTGDNGWPFPRGKATLYDAGWHVPLAIMWKREFGGGKVLEAPTSLIDLAATFIDAAGAGFPTPIDARSLLPLLRGAGHPRDHVLGAMERHMDGRQVQGQGYPMRALRTRQHLLIRNFHPEREPAGRPPKGPTDRNAVQSDIFAAFPDIDPGPAKADIVGAAAAAAPLHRYYEMATAKRPALELFDVTSDPYQLHNLAADPAQRQLLAQLDRRLLDELRRTGDPRTGPDGDVFDRYPTYSDPGFGRPDDY